ncbi:MAG: SAM-dependent methyltransferase, partial [Hyphomicrobiaceae bacterium]|nr:SAM-dependent methyltransferase [Hyphomicrobiaceae bacterium]
GADWDERCVALDEEGRLAFSARPADAATVALLRQRFPAGDAGQIVTLPDYRCIAPFFAPLPHAKPAWPALAALFIDYGEPDGGIADTLQAVRSHLYEHPLTSPGEADLSTLVDFGECARLAKDQQFDVDGPVTQAEFLGGLGAIERASRLMHANPAKAGAVEAGLARLLAPQGMGGRFKAIGLRRGLADPLPGLADASAA